MLVAELCPASQMSTLVIFIGDWSLYMKLLRNIVYIKMYTDLWSRDRTSCLSHFFTQVENGKMYLRRILLGTSWFLISQNVIKEMLFMGVIFRKLWYCSVFNSSRPLHLTRNNLFNLLNDYIKNVVCLINVCIKMENPGSFTYNYAASFVFLCW